MGTQSDDVGRQLDASVLQSSAAGRTGLRDIAAAAGYDPFSATVDVDDHKAY